jgi:hypothetical protein
MRLFLGICACLIIVLAVTPSAAAATAQSVSVPLSPVRHSGVSGTAVLSAAGQRTRAVVTLRHLPAHASAAVVGLAGRCSDLKHLSASFMRMPTLQVHGTAASGSGWIEFPLRGHENIRFSDLMRGGDVIIVYAATGRHPSHIAACGTIL